MFEKNSKCIAATKHLMKECKYHEEEAVNLR